MRTSMKGPEWARFRESYVYRMDKGLPILGRVDFIASLGYWWQTAEHTGVCHRLPDAQLRVEAALRSAHDGIAAHASRDRAEHVA